MVELLYGRAMAQSKIGSFCNAIADCDKALKFDKDNVKILLLRAECHSYKENFVESIKGFEDLLANEEVKKDAQKCEWLKSKIEGFQTALNHNNAREQMNIGTEYFRKCNYEEALRCCDEAISLWQQNISFYKKKIVCLILMKNYEAAIRECHVAAKIDSTFLENHSYMFDCYLIIGDLSGAEQAIQKYRSHSDDTARQQQLNDLERLKCLNSEVKTSFNRSDYKTTRKQVYWYFSAKPKSLPIEF